MTDSAHLDKVAEAIWRAGWLEESAGRTWRDCIYRKYYRHMAQAAIDALQLTEEWGVLGVKDFEPHQIFDFRSPADEQAAWRNEHGISASVASRLVSGWVRVDGGDA